jgi:hypothetical protein
LNPPPVVREATKEYQSEMDKIGAWITERCEVDPKAVTPFADLYADYEAWCREQGDEPMSKRRFGDRLSEKGFPPTPQPLPGGVKARKGLRLRPDQPDQSSPTTPPDPSTNDQPCADCAVVPNFQDNSIETEKLPRDSQTSAQEHNSTNPLIACHRDEKVSIPQSDVPTEDRTAKFAVRRGSDATAKAVAEATSVGDAPSPAHPTDPNSADRPPQPDQPDADFVDAEAWIDQWASDAPKVVDIETGEAISLTPTREPPRRLPDAIACRCGAALRTMGRSYACPRCRQPLPTTCRRCGRVLRVVSEGRAECVGCGLLHIFDRSRRLWLTDDDPI